MTRDYELVVILDPDIKAEEKEKLLAKIKKSVTDAEGKVLETKEWGKKELSYPLAKKTAGLFYLLELSAPSEKMSSIRQKLQVDDSILKFLVISKEGMPSPRLVGGLRHPKEA